MSEIYIAKNNERLDSVVYRHYGTLLYFDQVL
ncbi:phage tail protein, partial [Campylobacter jejuni]|nr:phage tail protein [Campylobacter jejuni]